MSIISTAVAAEATGAAAQTGSAYGSILMLLGFILIFYFLLWRPQSKRAKEHRQLVGGLAKGDEVIISGGLLGKIVKLSDDFVVLDIADGVEVKVQKSAVANSLPKGTFKSI